MTWGVLDDQHMVDLPGTVDLRAVSGVEIAETTDGDKKQGNIVLQPQPDDSVNDPLNWSNTWKYSILFILTLGSGITTACVLKALCSLGLAYQASKLTRYIQNNQYACTWPTYHCPAIQRFSRRGVVTPNWCFWIWTALASFFTSSGSDIYGKRPFYVISIALLAASNFWAFLSKNFASLVASRILAGIAAAPLMTLVTGSISDLFFVHQRGIMLGVWNLMQSSGLQIGPIISGFVFEKLGTSAVFGLTAVIYGLLALVAYFVSLETTYTRRNMQTKELDDGNSDEFTPDNDYKASHSYRMQLALFHGKLTSKPFWKGVMKPILLLTFPTIIYGTIVFSTYFSLLISMSVLTATIFTAAPYNLSSSQVGLTNLSVLFASLIGSPLAGWAADCAVKVMSSKNKTTPGRSEAEFRLVLVGIAMPFAAIGLFGFGLSVRNGLPLPYPLIFMAFFTLGFVFVTQSVLAYIVDIHTEDISQAFTAMNFISAVLVFLASSYINGWYLSAGPTVVFGVLGGLSVAVSLLTIPMYIYGKRLRSMIFRSCLTQKL